MPGLNYKPSDSKLLDKDFDVAVPKEDSTNDSIHWIYILDKIILSMEKIAAGSDMSERETRIFT